MSYRDRDGDLVEVCVTFAGITRSGESIVVVDADDRRVYIPKSKVDNEIDFDTCDEGDELTLSIPEWLARDRGFVSYEKSDD